MDSDTLVLVLVLIVGFLVVVLLLLGRDTHADRAPVTLAPLPPPRPQPVVPATPMEEWPTAALFMPIRPYMQERP